LLSGILSTWVPMLLIILIWLTPIILISRSTRVGKSEKLAWIIVTVFISWLVWVIFYLLAPLKPDKR